MAKYFISGPQGGISAKISYPKGFNPEEDKCDMVIVMHGFLASKRLYPVPQIVKSLNKAGYGALRFDFDGHGSSEGKFQKMTVNNEIADARAVFEYVCTLPYVRNIAFVGHSQGGVVAGMLAGELTKETNERRPKCIVQLAPAAVLKDDAQHGVCMGSKYDPVNPPEYVWVLFHKLGRNFIQQAQTLPIYEISCQYDGKVLLIHGTKDDIVPLSYSEKYNSLYPNSELITLEGVSHFMKSKDNATIIRTVEFINSTLSSF